MSHYSGRASIDELLGEVTTALEDDDELTDLLREHVARVVQTLRECLENFEVTGRADLRTGLNDLWVSLFAASGATTGENQSKWKNFAEKMGYPTESSLLVHSLASPFQSFSSQAATDLDFVGHQKWS